MRFFISPLVGIIVFLNYCSFSVAVQVSTSDSTTLDINPSLTLKITKFDFSRFIDPTCQTACANLTNFFNGCFPGYIVGSEPLYASGIVDCSCDNYAIKVNTPCTQCIDPSRSLSTKQLKINCDDDARVLLVIDQFFAEFPTFDFYLAVGNDYIPSQTGGNLQNITNQLQKPLDSTSNSQVRFRINGLRFIFSIIMNLSALYLIMIF